MTQILFSPEWLNLLVDSYAVLGVSVAADERRVWRSCCIQTVLVKRIPLQLL